jgi:ABC-type phosphate/phosphonate transport system, permease component
MVQYKKRRNQRILLALILLGSFIWSLLALPKENLVHAGGLSLIKEFFLSIFQIQISIESIQTTLNAIVLTVVYASAGIGLSIVIGLVFGLLSSTLICKGRIGSIVRFLFKGLTGFMRGIHELVWAWLFVAAIGLTPFAGVLAIALPYGEMLALNYRNNFDSAPKKPMQSLKEAGAGRMQVVLYGLFPQVFPEMISFTISIYECAVRASAIMSFVGLGGIGFQIQLALKDMKFSLVWMNVFALVLVVVLIDLWSSELRKRLHV